MGAVDRLLGAGLWGFYALCWPIPRAWLLSLADVAAPLLAIVIPLGTVRKNLRIVRSTCPEAWEGRSETRLLIDAVRHQLYTVVDFFKLVSQTPADILKVTSVEGWETIQTAAARGRGVVLVTAHYANWELAGAFFAIRGLPVHAFYYEQLLPSLDRFLAWARARSGMRMLHQRRGLRECIRALKSGGVVGFVADQDGSRDGVFLDFFGRLVSMPRGPYEFARHAGCDALPISCRRLPDRSYCLVVGAPLKLEAAEDVPPAARVVAAGFEADIRSDPAQWQLFYDRFWLRHVPRLRELGLLERAEAETTRDEQMALAPLPPVVAVAGEVSPSRLSGSALLRMAAFFYTPFLVCGLGWMAYRGRLEFLLWHGSFARAAGLGIALAAVTILFSSFVTSNFSWGRAMRDALAEILGGIEPRWACGLAAISSAGEEVLFRGSIQPEIGLVAASLLFGLIHLPLERRLIAWTAFAIAMGFCLGAIYDAAGGLLAPILAHFLVNAVNLIWLGEQ